MTDLTAFNWKNPNYGPVFAARAARLQRLRADTTGKLLPALRRHYRDNPVDFINDWGCTSDPRNAEIGQPVTMPFLLFPRQVEWVHWAMARWRGRQSGVMAKSRDMGATWLAVSFAVTLCLFYDEMAVGFGSRKLEFVDNGADPKSIFWKARAFLELLPDEFTGGWRARPGTSREGLINIPMTRSTIAGEGGDEIGRGARTGLYFVDEAASLVHPDLTDASLSQTTNCRIDMSTPKGLANPFATKVREWNSERVFLFHWRDDPRKDDAWYAEQVAELSSVVLAQEVDMDFAASVTGLLIPSAWVQSSIDAHVKLGLDPGGSREAALDVADEGVDKNAFAAAYGWLVEYVEEWSGKGDDIFGTVQKAFDLCDAQNLPGFRYDADGLGAGVRGDARVLNELRATRSAEQQRVIRQLRVEAFRGSAAVLQPDAQDVKGRKNSDFFQNLKAQSWWTLRRRFEQTHRAVMGETYDPTLLISISSKVPRLSALIGELSQPTYSLALSGKIVVDKAPDGTRSPNKADAVMILMGRHRRGVGFSDEALRRWAA